MRKLLYVPIVHAEADLGSLLADAKRAFAARHGDAGWHRHAEAIDRFWRDLRRAVADLPLDYERTYVYQDGLPVCGREIEVVSALARRGSPNHELVLWLVERGAHLVGTESPDLLLEEYELLKSALGKPPDARTPAPASAGRPREERAAQLLAERDDFIRRRIDKTLPDAATGILFMGLLHRVEEGLAGDISVSHVINHLPLSELRSRTDRGR